MTCSLQTYRARIGTFQNGTGTPIIKKAINHVTPKSKLDIKKTSFIIALLISNYCLLALSLPSLLHPTSYEGAACQNPPGSYTYSTVCMGCPAPSLGTIRYYCSISSTILAAFNTHYAEFTSRQMWDPGDTEASATQILSLLLADHPAWHQPSTHHLCEILIIPPQK